MGSRFVKVLEDEFNFKEVSWVEEDNHAYYYEGYENEKEAEIKVTKDTRYIDVYFRYLGNEDWYLIESLDYPYN